MSILEADPAVLLQGQVLLIMIPVALIVYPLTTRGGTGLAGPALPLVGLVLLRFDEVFDVEGPAEELGEPLEVEVQVQGQDLPLLLPQHGLPGRPLVLGLLLLGSPWILGLPQGLQLLPKFGGRVFVSVEVKLGEDFRLPSFVVFLLLIPSEDPTCLGIQLHCFIFGISLTSSILSEFDLLNLIHAYVPHLLYSELVPE